MEDDETPRTITFLGRRLSQKREDAPVWFGLFNHGRQGDVHLQVWRKEFDDGRKPRWFGSLSVEVKKSALAPYDVDCLPSRTLLEVTGQGSTFNRMQRAVRLRVKEVAQTYALESVDG